MLNKYVILTDLLANTLSLTESKPAIYNDNYLEYFNICVYGPTFITNYDEELRNEYTGL